MIATLVREAGPVHTNAMGNAGDERRLRKLRLSSQLIEGEQAAPRLAITDVVHRLLALQGQDFAQALWAVGLRSPGSTRAEVLGALERGEIVRSWPMRGTLFFVLPEDLRWMLALTTARMLASAATRQRQLDLDQSTLDRARDAAIAALTAGRQLGRSEFLQALNDAGIATSGQRGYHLIWYLAQTGTLCWGPPHGTQQALVLLDEWVPAARPLERDEALREFVFRYFSGHGPATLKDFVWWSKLTVADAKIGLALARDELTELVYDDVSYWVASSGLDDVPQAHGTHVLPAFDEYVIGYQERSLVLPPEYADRIVPGNNGVFKPTMVLDGTVAGIWRKTKNATGVTVAAEPFGSMSAAEQEAFANAADAYESFAGTVDSR